MVKRSILTIGFAALFLFGCTDSNTSLENSQEEIDELTAEINELNRKQSEFETPVEAAEEFSYLTDFTDQDLHSYRLFLKDRDLHFLTDFSPEQIVLLYFHSLSIDDLETVHALTYDGGSLVEYSKFTDQFYASELSHYENESILDFRYYDEIKIKEQEDSNEKVIVEISVTYGSYQSVRLLELQKEDNQWKLVLQHLL